MSQVAIKKATNRKRGRAAVTDSLKMGASARAGVVRAAATVFLFISLTNYRDCDGIEPFATIVRDPYSIETRFKISGRSATVLFCSILATTTDGVAQPAGDSRQVKNDNDNGAIHQNAGREHVLHNAFRYNNNNNNNHYYY